jgi:GNAT superfamily N-acetyltransferase
LYRGKISEVLKMNDDIVIKPMDKGFILWRCLHYGGLSAGSIDSSFPEGWDGNHYRAINVPVLEKIIDTYGSCAILAWAGEKVIGSLRFYPKWMFGEDQQGLCMQQDYPHGPGEQLLTMDFLALTDLAGRTLRIHCMMVGPALKGDNPYRRRGLGSRMVEVLHNWARDRGWGALEATAYESLDIVYDTFGQAGREFWEKLNFRLIRTEIEPALAGDNEVVRQMKQQATAKGIDPEKIKNRYLMRRELF